MKLCSVLSVTTELPPPPCRPSLLKALATLYSETVTLGKGLKKKFTDG